MMEQYLLVSSSKNKSGQKIVLKSMRGGRPPEIRELAPPRDPNQRDDSPDFSSDGMAEIDEKDRPILVASPKMESHISLHQREFSMNLSASAKRSLCLSPASSKSSVQGNRQVSSNRGSPAGGIRLDPFAADPPKSTRSMAQSPRSAALVGGVEVDAVPFASAAKPVPRRSSVSVQELESDPKHQPHRRKAPDTSVRLSDRLMNGR